MTQRGREPDRGGAGRLALRPQRADRIVPVIWPAAQQQRSRHVPAAEPGAHHPVTEIPQPIPLFRVLGGPASIRAAGHGPA